MIKKNISEKDEKDWKNFVDNISDVPNKDKLEDTKKTKVKRFKFDFHGYSLDDANKKIYEIINSCYQRGIPEILIITGKGKHSKSEDNVYVSKDLSILRNSIPEFIKNDSNLNSKIYEIGQPKENLGGSGALLIKLKKIIK